MLPARALIRARSDPRPHPRALPTRPAVGRPKKTPTGPRAPRPAFDPTDIIGKHVKKHFHGHGDFIGTIVSYDAQTRWYLIKWSDGDATDVTRDRAREQMRRYESEEM